MVRPAIALRLLLLGLGLYFCSWPLMAATPILRIAVLEFELKNLIPLSTTSQDQARTARVGQLLREALANTSHYTVIPVNPAVVAEANPGFGYLFDCLPCAVQLGRQLGLSQLVIGQVYKPSFLFSYLRVQVVNIEKQERIGNFSVEIKGQAEIVVPKGVATLACMIVSANAR